MGQHYSFCVEPSSRPAYTPTARAARPTTGSKKQMPNTSPFHHYASVTLNEGHKGGGGGSVKKGALSIDDAADMGRSIRMELDEMLDAAVDEKMGVSFLLRPFLGTTTEQPTVVIFENGGGEPIAQRELRLPSGLNAILRTSPSTVSTFFASLAELNTAVLSINIVLEGGSAIDVDNTRVEADGTPQFTVDRKGFRELFQLLGSKSIADQGIFASNLQSIQFSTESAASVFDVFREGQSDDFLALLSQKHLPQLASLLVPSGVCFGDNIAADQQQGSCHTQRQTATSMNTPGAAVPQPPKPYATEEEENSTPKEAPSTTGTKAKSVPLIGLRPDAPSREAPHHVLASTSSNTRQSKPKGSSKDEVPVNEEEEQKREELQRNEQQKALVAQAMKQRILQHRKALHSLQEERARAFQLYASYGSALGGIAKKFVEKADTTTKQGHGRTSIIVAQGPSSTSKAKNLLLVGNTGSSAHEAALVWIDSFFEGSDALINFSSPQQPKGQNRSQTPSRFPGSFHRSNATKKTSMTKRASLDALDALDAVQMKMKRSLQMLSTRSIVCLRAFERLLDRSEDSVELQLDILLEEDEQFATTDGTLTALAKEIASKACRSAASLFDTNVPSQGSLGLRRLLDDGDLELVDSVFRSLQLCVLKAVLEVSALCDDAMNALAAIVSGTSTQMVKCRLPPQPRPGRDLPFAGARSRSGTPTRKRILSGPVPTSKSSVPLVVESMKKNPEPSDSSYSQPSATVSERKEVVKNTYEHHHQQRFAVPLEVDPQQEPEPRSGTPVENEDTPQKRLLFKLSQAEMECRQELVRQPFVQEEEEESIQHSNVPVGQRRGGTAGVPRSPVCPLSTVSTSNGNTTPSRPQALSVKRIRLAADSGTARATPSKSSPQMTAVNHRDCTPTKRSGEEMGTSPKTPPVTSAFLQSLLVGEKSSNKTIEQSHKRLAFADEEQKENRVAGQCEGTHGGGSHQQQQEESSPTAADSSSSFSVEDMKLYTSLRNRLRDKREDIARQVKSTVDTLRHGGRQSSNCGQQPISTKSTPTRVLVNSAASAERTLMAEEREEEELYFV